MPVDRVRDQSRRAILRVAAASVAGCVPLLSARAQAPTRPKPGDLLALDGAEGPPAAITTLDVKPGSPLLAFPFEKESKQTRNDSRFNKVVLVRVDESSLDAESKARAAGGVMAFSAVCTHQACDVKTWLAAEKALVCFCHGSKFLPLEAGRVTVGPATRALPFLPLKLDGELLIVAGTFSAPPGPPKA